MPNFITFTNLRLVASTQFNTWSCWVAALIEGEGDTRLLFSVMSGRNPRGDLAVDAISLILNLSQRRKLVITHGSPQKFFQGDKIWNQYTFCRHNIGKNLKVWTKRGNNHLVLYSIFVNAPAYLRVLFILTFSWSIGRCRYSISRLCGGIFFHWVFSISGPSVWNSLHCDLRPLSRDMSSSLQTAEDFSLWLGEPLNSNFARGDI